MSVLYFVYAHYMYFNAFPELFTGIVVYLYMFEQSIECNSPKQKKKVNLLSIINSIKIVYNFLSMC